MTTRRDLEHSATIRGIAFSMLTAVIACSYALASQDDDADIDFFERRGLTPSLLRRVSQHQVGRLVDAFDALALDPAVIRRDDVRLTDIGGFAEECIARDGNRTTH